MRQQALHRVGSWTRPPWDVRALSTALTPLRLLDGAFRTHVCGGKPLIDRGVNVPSSTGTLSPSLGLLRMQQQQHLHTDPPWSPQGKTCVFVYVCVTMMLGGHLTARTRGIAGRHIPRLFSLSSVRRVTRTASDDPQRLQSRPLVKMGRL